MLVRACKNSKIINHKSKMKNRIKMKNRFNLHDTEKGYGLNKTSKVRVKRFINQSFNIIISKNKTFYKGWHKVSIAK